LIKEEVFKFLGIGWRQVEIARAVWLALMHFQLDKLSPRGSDKLHYST
jgi:hypothetical protein